MLTDDIHPETKMASYQDAVAPHKDWPATVMAVDCTGHFTVLGSRKGLAFIDLNCPNVITKKVPRNSKWECNALEWNPHLSDAHIFANALLSSCSMDQFIYIWDLREGKKPASSLQAIVGASQVKWNRVNRHVLATSHDGDVRIWDLRKGNTPVVYLTAHLSKIHGLDWSRSSGTTLATCSSDTTVKLWNTEQPQQPENKLNAKCPVWRARFTPFGEGLVTVTLPQLRRGENSLSLWNIPDVNSPVAAPVNTFVGHSDVACSGDTSTNFPSRSTNETAHSMSDELIEMAIAESVIIDTPKSFPDLAAQPQTLQQEFALINVNIPNVTVEQLDAGHRSCTVCATNGPDIVSLVINFPSMYPNQAIPSFEFTADTSIDTNTKTKLMKTLRETAQTHVNLNQTCLEPCLRQLLQERLPMDQFAATVPQLHGRLDPISYGSYADAAVPFPRTSGAKFCACGLLVCFNLPGRYGGRVGSGGEPTPRSLSAFSAYSSRPSSGPALPPLINRHFQKTRQRHAFGSFGQQTRTFTYRALSKTEDPQDRQKYSGVPSRNSDVGLVVIRDVSAMMPIHQSLGQAYTLEGNNITKICKKNLSAAMTTGRKDLVQTWSLLSLVLDEKLAPSDSMDEAPWALHPFGKKLVSSLMDYYLNIRDIQTLGMLSCSVKRPKPVGSVSDPMVTESSPSEWSEVSFPLSGGLSPTVFIRSKDPMEEQRKQFQSDCSTRCYNCSRNLRGAQCGSCKSFGLQCVICHVAVRGASNFCVACGHGGHAYHLLTWFESMDVCPTGCGCRCLEVGTFIVD
ncbi:GATOR complex protein WDR59 [Acropora cervicornis]|uniref:GATOR complex protein WDR59 n=1 Tax=Acropora cervicornis TaxID=6130 RepID=A0AAD9Q4V2_ACRCE|nr:GATOR complex protein WDR59 [Acropora cervicornis]